MHRKKYKFRNEYTVSTKMFLLSLKVVADEFPSNVASSISD